MKKTLFAGLLLTIASVAAAQVDPARVVATVNGVEIKGAEYYRRMEFLPGVGKNLGDRFAEFPPGFLTLEQLITEKLIYQLAREKGVAPTADEIKAELDYRKTKNPTLVVDWIAGGRTEAELFNDVKFDLTQFKLLTAGITVTDQEVEKFYNDNKPMYTSPTRLQLRVIVVRTKEEADAVDKELAAKKPFAEVAKAHSIDVTAKLGGDYGTVPVTMLSENVRKSLQSTPVGTASLWFSANQDPNSKEEPAKFRFLLEKVIPEEVHPLDADLRRQTRQRIMMDAGKNKNHLKQDLDALRAKATIDIKEKGFAEAYKKFMDAYLKPGS